jgi:DNA repair exonuclease SbcCD ATPase subunit
MIGQDNKLRMPQIRKISLRNFSLFNKEKNLDIKFPEGVFCLAGANGLGKSTFLATVAYAITGIVPDPNKKQAFKTVKQYYKQNQKYAPRFFRGRILPQDIKNASVSMEFVAGQHLYKISRSFIVSDELLDLKIFDKNNKLLPGFDSLHPRDLHLHYCRKLVEDIGLADFDQLVFLLHVVLTFDERRHLLLWDKKALEQTLYITFGIDVKQARTADNLRREIFAADSNARNSQWEAKRWQDEINRIMEVSGIGSEPEEIPKDLFCKYKDLHAEQQTLAEQVRELEDELRSIELKYATSSSKYTTLRSEYEEMFSCFAKGHALLTQHPLIMFSLREGKCGLCASEGADIRESITSRVSVNKCPICGSKIENKGADPTSINRLKKIDQNIMKLQTELRGISDLRQQLNNQLDNENMALQKATVALLEFESEHGNLRSSEDSGEMRELIENYRHQIELLTHRESEFIKKKNNKTQELKLLQKKLERQYFEAEKIFVPLFHDLSVLFLGIDIDIKMERLTPVGVNLLLTVREAERRQFDQLSESQRFFLDIALRMSLAQYFSAKNAKATLFLDTPEGSLDIAYESCAGEMLAEFARKGNAIIMTANINTSALLLSLAKKCRSKKMELCRMTPWAVLTDVQESHEKDFDSAFKKIAKVLAK